MHDNLFAVPDIDILDRNDEPLKEEIRAAAMGTSPFSLCFCQRSEAPHQSGECDFFVTKLWREGFPVTLTDTNELSFIYLGWGAGCETVWYRIDNIYEVSTFEQTRDALIIIMKPMKEIQDCRHRTRLWACLWLAFSPRNTERWVTIAMRLWQLVWWTDAIRPASFRRI